MKRRDVLRFSGAVGALAVAGCVSDGDGDGETDDGSGGGETDDTPTPTPEPEETETPDETETESDSKSESTGEHAYEDPVAAVEAFVQAFHDGDVEAYKALVHDEGEMSASAEQDLDSEMLQENAPELKSVELVESGESTAKVKAEILPAEAERTTTSTFTLTNVDGAWRISRIGGPDEVTPKASFDFDTEDGSMEITLSSGDSIQAANLYVRGDGVEPTGPWHELDDDIAPGDDVKAGYSVTVDIEDEYEIQVVWEGENGAATLSTVSGASESASESDGRFGGYLSDTKNYDGTVEDLTGQEKATVSVGELPDSEAIYAFDPPAIRVDTGTTVVWEWNGESAHSVVHEPEDDKKEAFKSELKSDEGTTFEHTFEEADTYRYFCQPHRALGMKGVVVVE